MTDLRAFGSDDADLRRDLKQNTAMHCKRCGGVTTGSAGTDLRAFGSADVGQYVAAMRLFCVANPARAS